MTAGTSTTTSSGSGRGSSEAEQRKHEVFALQERLPRGKAGDDPNDDEELDDGTAVITSFLLESTLVPALKDWIKDQEAGDSRVRSSKSTPNVSRSTPLVEERKDASETLPKTGNKESDDRTRYAVAILECLVSFVAGTCVSTSKLVILPSTQQSAYNSLSFKPSKSSTSPLSSQKFKMPKKKPNPKPKAPRSLSTPKEDKAFFVTCGAFEMAVYLLRRVLEDHTRRVSSTSWSKHKRDALDTFDSIGVEDSIANVQIESTMPSDPIPVLVTKILACLAHNASDDLKTDRILPLLDSIVHRAMMVFLPCAELQRYGCWTLSSLSNPLLQELVAAGSVSMLVKTMKCHPCDAGVQEHGNNALYNLLPLLVACYTKGKQLKRQLKQQQQQQQQHKGGSAMGIATGPLHHPLTPPDHLGIGIGMAVPLPCVVETSIEIDGKQLEDYSSLLPSLPAIVLRGMEEHPDHLAVQQYGLLVLTRLCQQDQETYEIVVSEGGLNALLAVVSMATTHTYSAMAMATTTITVTSDYSSSTQSVSERHDCLAQMACQFLRDLSRPTNSSMDILRIIAVKGGTQTVLGVLDHYNQEHVCGGHVYHNHHNRFAVNIIDPAMACLRNLMTNEDNRSEIMTLSGMSRAKRAANNANNNNQTETDPSSECVDVIPIVLATMDLYPLDAAIQAYGCDLLGRLAQGEESARMELIESTILNNNTNRNTNDNNRSSQAAQSTDSDGDDGKQQRRLFGNHSRLWKRGGGDTADSSTTTTTTTTIAAAASPGDNNNNSDDDDDGDFEHIDLQASPSEEGADVIDLSDRFGRAGLADDSEAIAGYSYSGGTAPQTQTSTARGYYRTVDSLVTVVRAMRNHRSHSGVQERSVVLLLAMVLDRSAAATTTTTTTGAAANTSSASSYLIQRLREVYEAQRDASCGDPATLLAFLQSTAVTPKGVDRWKKLVQVVEDYDRKTTNNNKRSVSTGISLFGSTDAPRVGTFFARGWNKLAGGANANANANSGTGASASASASAVDPR